MAMNLTLGTSLQPRYLQSSDSVLSGDEVTG